MPFLTDQERAVQHFPAGCEVRNPSGITLSAEQSAVRERLTAKLREVETTRLRPQ